MRFETKAVFSSSFHLCPANTDPNRANAGQYKWCFPRTVAPEWGGCVTPIHTWVFLTLLYSYEYCRILTQNRAAKWTKYSQWSQCPQQWCTSGLNWVVDVFWSDIQHAWAVWLCAVICLSNGRAESWAEIESAYGKGRQNLLKLWILWLGLGVCLWDRLGNIHLWRVNAIYP